MKGFRYIIVRLIFTIVALTALYACNEKRKFDGYLYPIKENGLYGYIDSMGNKIIEPKFLWVSSFHNGLAMAVVDTIYRVVPDSMAYEVGERDSVINVYRMYTKYGYIDKAGRFAIKPIYVSYVSMPKQGYIVNDMGTCSNALSQHIFHDKRALYCDTINWKRGYIDINGNSIIDAKYYYSEPFNEGLAVVRDIVAAPISYDSLYLNSSKLRCSYIDTKGNAITEFKYKNLTRFNGRRGIGSYIEIIKDSLEDFYGYTVHNDIIDKDGRVIKDLGMWKAFYGYSRDGISVARQVMHLQVYEGMQESYSFVDENGDYLKPLKGLTNFQIDSLNKCNDILEVLQEDASIAYATYFNDGFAGISPDGEYWFVIDKYLIIHGYGKESIFNGFQPFMNGLAAVKRNGKWGYINKKIKEQIPCKYDSCGAVYPYLEEVFEYDIQGKVRKKAYINRKDSLVWESSLYNTEKIVNRYSKKDKKDWGKWTYESYSFNKNLQYIILGSLVVLLFTFGVIWKSLSFKSSKEEKVEELASLKKIESIITTDAQLNVDNYDDTNPLLSYPTIGQYKEVIRQAAKTPDDYFDKLKHLRPVLDINGEPIMSSGNFAVIFKMKDEYGMQYAVKCFHRAQQGRGKNYKLICEELAKVSSPYLSPIKYYEKELFVDSDEYPVLLMEWVEGVTLDKYVRRIIDDGKALSQLATNFRNLAIWLLSQPFAHGDLKPDNILVKKDGSLVLVDYDGMFVPAMQGQKAREIGSPDFRNPSMSEDDFNKDIDNFPIVSILLSLELLVENKDYLSQFGAEDRLLLSKNDYLNLRESAIYKIAIFSHHADVPELAIQLEEMAKIGSSKANDLLVLLQNFNWGERITSNRKAERFALAFVVVYSVFMLIMPLYFRTTFGWNIIQLSMCMLSLIVILCFILILFDYFRPNKRYHLTIVGNEGPEGCLAWLTVIPVLLMADSIVEWLNENVPFLQQPLYKGEWYVTAAIWALWYVSNMACISFPEVVLEWRLKHFKTQTETIEENKEKVRSKIRSELKREEEDRKKKEIEQKIFGYYDDLPF